MESTGGGILRKGKYSKYNPEANEPELVDDGQEDDHTDFNMAPINTNGMISIADLLKHTHPKPKVSHHVVEHPTTSDPSVHVQFNEHNIEEINHIAALKRAQRHHVQLDSDPKTPYHEEETGAANADQDNLLQEGTSQEAVNSLAEQDELAKKNMAANKHAMSQLSQVDVHELNAKLKQAKLEGGQDNDVAFNRKRKEHYKNEFQKAMGHDQCASNHI